MWQLEQSHTKFNHSIEFCLFYSPENIKTEEKKYKIVITNKI